MAILTKTACHCKTKNRRAIARSGIETTGRSPLNFFAPFALFAVKNFFSEECGRVFNPRRETQNSKPHQRRLDTNLLSK
jgi:ribosomal protein S18